MNILIATDKFKGSLTAQEVCEVVKDGLLEAKPDSNVDLLPLADGGEGSLEIMTQMLGLDQIEVDVKDPLKRPMTAHYGLLGQDAFVEMALASGLQLLEVDERNATETSSNGLGELIRHAVKVGHAKRVFVFVGGSATNDGGSGMAAELGISFLDADGINVTPKGASLASIQTIIRHDEVLKDSELVIVTDVKNKLLGPKGASHQYAKQKGATPDDIELLEHGLKHYAAMVKRFGGVDTSGLVGSGAAGGIAVSASGLFGATIQSGIDTILRAVSFEERLRNADLLITGEGKIDEQTLQGKVVHGVAQKAHELGIPVWSVCGVSELTAAQLASIHVDRCLSIQNGQLSTEECMVHANTYLKERVTSAFRI